MTGEVSGATVHARVPGVTVPQSLLLWDCNSADETPQTRYGVDVAALVACVRICTMANR